MQLKLQNIFGLTFSLMSVLLICFLFAPISVLQILILFGLGHIYIAFYSLLKSKKTRLEIVYLTPIAFIFFFSIAYFIYHNFEYTKIYILLSFLYFTIHFYYDEVVMNFMETTTKHLTGLISLLSIFTAVYMGQYYFPFNSSLEQTFFYISIFTFLYYTFILFNLFSKKETRSQSISQIFFFYSMYLVALFFYLSDEHISYYYLAGFVVIFHYIRWYIHFFFVTQRIDLEKHRKYLLTVLVFNFFFLVLAFAPIANDSYVYLFFFHPIYFYALANAHVTVSFTSEFLKKRNSYQI